MSSLFELNCYLIGLTSVAATFYCYGVQDTFIRNNSRLHTLCAYACWELNKRIHLKKMITFVGIWTALIGLAIAESQLSQQNSRYSNKQRYICIDRDLIESFSFKLGGSTYLTSRISNLYQRSRQRKFFKKGYIQYEMANTDCRIDNNSVSFSLQCCDHQYS